MEVPVQMEIRPGDLRCPSCYHRDVVASLRRGVVDAVMHRLGREPLHCRFCGRRFYVPLKKNGQAES